MLKLKVKQVMYESNILWQHKKAKTARYSIMDLKHLHILTEKIQQRSLGLGESTAGVT